LTKGEEKKGESRKLSKTKSKKYWGTLENYKKTGRGRGRTGFMRKKHRAARTLGKKKGKLSNASQK